MTRVCICVPLCMVGVWLEYALFEVTIQVLVFRPGENNDDVARLPATFTVFWFCSASLPWNRC
jgi:hypothetical protein